MCAERRTSEMALLTISALTTNDSSGSIGSQPVHKMITAATIAATEPDGDDGPRVVGLFAPWPPKPRPLEFQYCFQEGRIDGLDQEQVDSGVVASLATGHVGKPRDGDQKAAAKLIVAAQANCQIAPVDAGHAHVEQHHIGRQSSSLAKRGRAVVGFLGGVAPMSHEQGQAVGRITFVIHNEHSQEPAGGGSCFETGAIAWAGQQRLTAIEFFGACEIALKLGHGHGLGLH
jgi:hypothetical protein